MESKAKKMVTARLALSMVSNKSVSISRHPTHVEVSEYAIALWERSGKPQDRDISIWLEAERELRASALMAEAAGNAFADTMALLGDATGSPKNMLQSFGDQSGVRSATSL